MTLNCSFQGSSFVSLLPVVWTGQNHPPQVNFLAKVISHVVTFRDVTPIWTCLIIFLRILYCLKTCIENKTIHYPPEQSKQMTPQLMLTWYPSALLRNLVIVMLMKVLVIIRTSALESQSYCLTVSYHAPHAHNSYFNESQTSVVEKTVTFKVL